MQKKIGFRYVGFFDLVVFVFSCMVFYLLLFKFRVKTDITDVVEVIATKIFF